MSDNCDFTTVSQDITSAEGIIIHGVNCRGKMGAGVAKAIKLEWPHVYDAYVDRVNQLGAVACLGTIQLVKASSTTLVLNCFTQLNYGHHGKYVSYDAIDSCMRAFAEFRRVYQINMPLNFAAIGAGAGGGEWSIIKHIIEHHIPSKKFLWII